LSPGAMQMSKRIWISVLIVAGLGLVGIFWVLNRPDSQEVGTIRIGAISPFTGEGANYGKAARTGIDMAVDEISARGGIKGKRLVIQYEDDKGSATDAVSAFRKLVDADKVPAILGPFYSGNVLACAPVAERSRVVLLTV